MKHFENKRYLDITDRYDIEIGVSMRHSFRQIAEEIGRHPSTVAREILENRYFIKGKYFMRNDCRKASKCYDKRHMCGNELCNRRCITCIKWDCRQHCRFYVRRQCVRICLLSSALECDPDYLLGIYDHPTKEVTDVASALPISRTAIEGLMKLKQDRDSDKLKELNGPNPYSTFAEAIDYMICGMLDSAGYYDDSGHYEDYGNNQSYSLIFDLIKSAKALKAMDEIPADQADANPFFADNYNNMEMSYRGILFNLGQELSNIIAAYVNEHIYKPEEV